MSDHEFSQQGTFPMIRLIRYVACATLLLGLTATGVRADLVIVESNATIAPGGIGTMDFTVTSTSGDQLTDFGMELLITPLGSPVALLQFSTSQLDPFDHANYVFAGQSSGQDLPLPFWSVPSQTNYPDDTIFGGDSNDFNLGAVTIPSTPGAAHTFLFSVQFQVPLGAMLGDQYQISLVADPNFTYFDDANGDPLAYSVARDGGTVTVAAPVVPEPSSLILGLAGAGIFVCARMARRCRN